MQKPAGWRGGGGGRETSSATPIFHQYKDNSA